MMAEFEQSKAYYHIKSVLFGVKPSSLHNLAISWSPRKVRSKHSCGKLISHPALEQL